MPVRLLLAKIPKIPKILKNVQKRSKLDVLTTGANSLQSVHGLLSFVRNVLYSVLSGCGTVRTMVRRKVESFCAGTGRWQVASGDGEEHPQPFRARYACEHEART